MSWIDPGQLVNQGLGELRQQAIAIAEAGLAAANGGRALRTAVRPVQGGLEAGGRFFPLPDEGRLLVIGGGKATLPVARTLETLFGDRIGAGAIVLRRGEQPDLERLEVHLADHPLPSPDSVKAAARIVELAGGAGPTDLVVTCFSGGRSALLCQPPAGVSFADKRRMNQLLLASGMPIVEINTVRKHVSQIKGGRLARAIAPARILNLLISDVAGDQLDILADLTTADSSTPGDALGVLERYDLLDEMPTTITDHLRSPDALSPGLDDVPIENLMLANGASVTEAMCAAARELGLQPVVVSTQLEGDAVSVGQQISALATAPGSDGQPRYPAGTVLLGCGGEATVDLGSGKFGRGGPNQEATLSAALELDGHPVAALFLDTDGSDGGTRAAGAVCDGETVRRADTHGVDIHLSLAAHASTEPLRALGDLIETGPTGTNVNDLFVAVVGSPGDIPAPLR